MELFNIVPDSVEHSDERDTRWLDVAIDLLAHSDEPARAELRDVLKTIDHDYRLGKAESRTLRAAIGRVPEQPSLPDQRLSESALAESALVVVELCRAYHEAVERSTGGATT